MPNQMIKINEYNYEVNTEYEYEDQDITAILEARVCEYNGQINNIPVYPMAAIDTINLGQLKQRLDEDKSRNLQKKRIILIPCNIGNYHWVGLLLEFSEENTLIRAEFMNSTNSEIPPTLQTQLSSIYSVKFKTYDEVIKQNDKSSCGACTIDNLILRMMKRNPSENINMYHLRARHLDILRIDSMDENIAENERKIRRNFYDAFYQRQKLNQRTFSYQQLTPVNASKNTYASESEIQAIIKMVEMILAIDEEKFNDEIKQIFKSISEKEHKTIIDGIRSALWNLRDNSDIQKISEVIFGIKEISNFKTIEAYNKEATLQFDYCYLEYIAHMITNTSKLNDLKNCLTARGKIFIELKDQDDLKRQKAAESFRDLPGFLKENELNLLRDIAIYDVYQTVRIAAAEALYIKGIEEDRKKARETILELLAYPGFGKPHQDGADLVRARAAQALSILKDCSPEIIKALTYATEDTFQNVRDAAINSLQQLNMLNTPFDSMQSFQLPTELRLVYLKCLISEQAKILKSEFEKTKPDYSLIKENFCLLSWRSNEISWKYKYEVKSIISEELWHLFYFICRYLVMTPNVDLGGWKEIADECEKLAVVINKKLDEHNSKLECPILKEKIRPAFARSQLKMLFQQMNNFFNSSSQFNSDNSIDCYALLGLLMVIGEGAKRLEGVDPKLSTSVTNKLDIIQSVRDLLEKKLPGNLFDSPKLMAKLYEELKILKDIIEKYFQEPPISVDMLKADGFKQLLDLLKEESSYKYPEQTKVFFSSLSEEQKKYLEYLKSGNYQKFLNLFNIDYEKFKATTHQNHDPETYILSEDQRAFLIEKLENENYDKLLKDDLKKHINSSKTALTTVIKFIEKKQDEEKRQKENATQLENELSQITNKLEKLLPTENSSKYILAKSQRDTLVTEIKDYDKSLKNDLKKRINSTSTPLVKIIEFLKQKKLKTSDKSIASLQPIVNQLKEYLPQAENNNNLLKELTLESGIEESKLLNMKKCFDMLDKNRQEINFTIILFEKIRETPWLLNLTTLQCSFLKILNQEESIDNREELNNVLKSNGLDETKIDDILNTKKLLYSPMPYHKKFKYNKQKTVDSEIERIIRMINNLISLLLEIKKEKSANFLTDSIIKNYKYQFALQMAIKAFGVFIKDKMSDESKKQLLAINTNELSEKHIKLLELFRNELAHRASETDPAQLAWFALQWAIISFPTIKNLLPVQPSALSANFQENREEIVVTESLLTKDILLIKDLAKKHGCGERVRVFGHFFGCILGIQAELNLIVDTLPEIAFYELYILQWEIHFVLGYNVRIFTEKSLQKYLCAAASESHIQRIITQATDLTSLQHLNILQEMLETRKWYSIILSDEKKRIRRIDNIDIKDVDLKKVRTIVLTSKPEDFLSRKQYHEKLLEIPEVKDIILKKAKFYTDNLLELVKNINLSVKPIFLERLKTTMTLNSELDQFYESHVDEILSFHPEISRHNFRGKMRTEHEKLPSEAIDFDLARRAKHDWDNEGSIIEKISDQYDLDVVNLLNFLYFLLDEVRNPKIVELIFEKDIHKDSGLYNQLLEYVYADFCRRFTDPYEEDASVSFIEQTFNFSISISNNFDRPVNLTRLPTPTRHDYLRIAFYAEVLEELPSTFLPIPLIDSEIETHVRRKILNIRHDYQPLPESKKMTVNTLFLFKRNWQYIGKIQRLHAQAATLESPLIKDFDALLKKEGINKEKYPGYEEDKAQFNQFQEVRNYLEHISYYEKYIRHLEQDKAKREYDATSLNQSSAAYNINQEYVQEIVTRITFLEDLETRHIKGLLGSQYIINHSSYRDANFEKNLTQEITDWIYNSRENNLDKDKLKKLMSDCFVLRAPQSSSSFFSTTNNASSIQNNLPETQKNMVISENSLAP